MRDVFLGVDCGGTNIRVACGDAKGEIIKQMEIPSDSLEYGTNTVERIINVIEAMIREIDKSENEIKSIGIGVPGVYYQEKICLCSNLADLEVEKIVEYFKEKHALHLHILNDVKCAALGEQWLGACRNVYNCVYVNIGTGLSMALILNGQVYMGENNASGEIGFCIPDITVQEGYGSGKVPLENIFSGIGLENRVKELYMKDKEAFTSCEMDNTLAQMNTKQVFEQYKKGCEPIVQLINENIKHIYLSLANLSIILNPKRIVFGGGVAQDMELFFSDMADYMKKMVPFPPELIKASLGRNAGLYGAIRLAILNSNKK